MLAKCQKVKRYAVLVELELDILNMLIRGSGRQVKSRVAKMLVLEPLVPLTSCSVAMKATGSTWERNVMLLVCEVFIR